MQTITSNNTMTQIEDKALSPKGRFNRLSFLGWNFLISIILTGIMLIIMLLAGGSMALFMGVNDPASELDTAGFASLGIIYIAMFIFTVVYLYFIFVISIRRLHDMNATGWLSLLILIPVVNFVMFLVLIFVPGTKGLNKFGDIRASKGWEVVLGWLYVAFFILGIIAYGALFSFLMSSGFDPSTLTAPDTY